MVRSRERADYDLADYDLAAELGEPDRRTGLRSLRDFVRIPQADEAS
jgi:hypothetical protein